MPLATFTVGDATLTVVELGFMFLWIWIAVGVIFDIFRSHDLSNGRKALWVLCIFVFPLVGVLGYLILRGHTMHEHQAQDAASRGTAGDLVKLADLRDRGVITTEEFDRAKTRVLQ